MSEIRFVNPPRPEPGGRWCLMCLMAAKQRLLDANPGLGKYLTDGHDRLHLVSWDDSVGLMEAIADGISDIPQLGLIPVCFTHLASIRLRTASRLIGPEQLPPGLIRGTG